jgi:predicted transcriptional regulator of viral defense system
MARYSTLDRVGAVAEDQWGLVTRRQVEKAGVSPATVQRLADNSVLERVTHGVYRLAGAPVPEQLALRAAWLQLAPDVPAWERGPAHGVVSHRSAAAVYGLGHFPADEHDFVLSRRRQTRRPDVRLHRGRLERRDWTTFRGLPVTRPARIASDLLSQREDPEGVGHVIADALRWGYDDAGAFAGALAPHAARFGLPRGDGWALLRWLLDLAGDRRLADG